MTDARPEEVGEEEDISPSFVVSHDFIVERNENQTNSPSIDKETQEEMSIVRAATTMKGQSPSKEDLDRIKEELNRTLNEEKELINRQMNLLMEKQNIKMAIEQIEMEEERAKLMMQRDKIEQVRTMHS